MRNVMLWSILIVSSLQFNGCSQQEEHTDLHVTNGRVSSNADPAVVLLRSADNHICTGTYINDHMILTAAHCLDQAKGMDHVSREVRDGSSRYLVMAEGLRFIRHPNYKVMTDLQYDLGLIVVAPFSSRSWISLAAGASQVGDEVRMVGYGHNKIKRDPQGSEIEEEGAGEKRSGTNRITKLQDGSIRFVGVISEVEAKYLGKQVGAEVGIGGGDSGGPLLNKAGQLVGVVSSQSFEWDEWNMVKSVESIFVDLSSAAARDFVGDQLMTR